MRKLSLFLFITTFLICTSLSKVTSVSADVTFGGDDVTVVSDDMLDVYRHLALLGSVGDLVSNGVSSISVSGTSDVNSLLDSIFDNLASGLSDDNPVSNFGLGVWETLDEFNTYLTDKAYDLMSDFDWYWDSGISDVVDFLGGVSSTKVPYKPNLEALKQFKALSKTSSTVSPSPNQDYLVFLNRLNDHALGNFFWYDSKGWTGFSDNPSNYTWFFSRLANGDNTIVTNMGSYWRANPCVYPCQPSNLYLVSNSDGTYSGTLLTSVVPNKFKVMYSSQELRSGGVFEYASPGNPQWISGEMNAPNLTSFSLNYDHQSLTVIFNNLITICRNIGIYVDGVPWSLPFAPITIYLDIDGILKMFESEKPVTYYYPSGTQIDYQALYNVILRAIQNGTPVSQTTINEGNVYYDSHDTVYSPTIFNYYSTSEDEQDFIDDILNLATIPNFDTALVEPLAEPMTNGAAIFGVGVSVFPHDLLLLLGAGFVLVLFVALINRLIE